MSRLSDVLSNEYLSRLPSGLVYEQIGSLLQNEEYYCVPYMFALWIDRIGIYPALSVDGIGFSVNTTEYTECDKRTKTILVDGFSHDTVNVSTVLSRTETGLERWKNQLWQLGGNTRGMIPMSLRRNVFVYLLDHNRIPVIGVKLKRCLMTGYKISALNSTTSGFVTVDVPLVHDGWDLIHLV